MPIVSQTRTFVMDKHNFVHLNLLKQSSGKEIYTGTEFGLDIFEPRCGLRYFDLQLHQILGNVA